jgi:hypothetical protein
MCTFIQETLKPEIFWTALASIGTLLAVMVALFMPLIIQRSRNNRIERLILAELEGNLNIIKNMASRESRSLPNGIKISAIQNNDALVTHINLRLWHQYRYELAADRPDSYEKYHSLYRLAEAIIDAPKEPTMRLMIQTDEAGSFVTRYEELIK